MRDYPFPLYCHYDNLECVVGRNFPKFKFWFLCSVIDTAKGRLVGSYVLIDNLEKEIKLSLNGGFYAC